jgi:hypothetical protein
MRNTLSWRLAKDEYSIRSMIGISIGSTRNGSWRGATTQASSSPRCSKLSHLVEILSAEDMRNRVEFVSRW